MMTAPTVGAWLSQLAALTELGNERAQMEAFFELLVAVRDPDMVDGIESALDRVGLKEPLRARWERHLRNLELEAAGVGGSVLAREAYSGLASELALAGPDPGPIVVVGVGPFPETLRAFARATKVPIVGLDRDGEAVAAARSVADARVTVVQADGVTYNYALAGSVFVTNGVRCKADVLTRIAHTARGPVRTIVRLPVRLGRLLYDDLGLLGPWRVVSEIRASPLSRTLALEIG